MKNSMPAQYHRNSKSWRKYLGLEGQVLSKTTIRVAAPELQKFTPYDFLLIELTDSETEKQRLEIMAADGFSFETGDKVRLVLKKLGHPSQSGVIPYGLKAVPISYLEE